jgi:hypothetical protein
VAGEDAGVVAVAEDAAATPFQPVDTARGADLEGALFIARLDEQVQVVVLHGHVHDAEVLAPDDDACSRADRLVHSLRPQSTDTADHPHVTCTGYLGFSTGLATCGCPARSPSGLRPAPSLAPPTCGSAAAAASPCLYVSHPT